MNRPDPDAPRRARPLSPVTRLVARRHLPLFACAAIVLAGCHAKQEAAPAPKPVVAVAVHHDGHPPLTTLPGQVQARNTTPLSFRVSGKIIKRLVRLGDTVKPGQAVAQLDPADLQKNTANAQAQFDAAAHRLVYARQQLDRDRAQAKENLIAPTQIEQTQDAYAAAAAQRDAARSQLDLARDQLRYATLRADHAGFITTEDADTGQNVTAGQPVFHLAWSGQTDVVCDVPERLLAALRVGRRAVVTLPALPGKTFDAQVREVSPAADPQSRTYRVKLTLHSPDANVRIGMTANVSFDGTKADAAAPRFTLPSTALFHQGQHPAVWIVRAGSDTLELRPVDVASYGERTVSISRGLADGERVVLQGVHAVNAGEHVRIVAPLHPEDFAS